MRIEWLPIADRDRASLLAYLAARIPNAALAMGDAIDAAVVRLALHPYSARQGRVAGTRELVVPRTPYLIVYRIEQAAVVILRMLHGAQDWPSS